MSFSEKIGGVEQNQEAILDFRMILTDCELANLGYTGLMVTWVNKRGGMANVQERLDRYVCNEEWMGLFPYTVVEKLEYTHLDRCPILLGLEGKLKVKQN